MVRAWHCTPKGQSKEKGRKSSPSLVSPTPKAKFICSSQNKRVRRKESSVVLQEASSSKHGGAKCRHCAVARVQIIEITIPGRMRGQARNKLFFTFYPLSFSVTAMACSHHSTKG